MADETKSVSATSIMRELVQSFDKSILTTVYENLSEFLSGNKSFYTLLIICGIIVFSTGMVSLNAINIGYRHAYGVTREIPWGILISSYIFFVVTSTGLCIVSSIGHVFGVKELMPIAKRSVFLSVATIFGGFMVIFFDIENPFRMAIWNVFSPNLSSNLWWMGTLYGAYMMFMAIEFALLLLDQHKFAMYAGLAGLLTGVVAHSNLGAIFGMLHSRDYWYGPYLPIYFIASAIMSGCTAIIFFTWLGYKINNEQMEKPMQRALEIVSKLCMMMISILAFFIAWKMITGFVGTEGKQAALAGLLSGPYAFNFWVFEVLMGLVIPFILLFYARGNLNIMFTATVPMVIGIFFMRYDLVVIGQAVPSYHELGVVEYAGLLPYRPSFHEIFIVVGAMAMVGMTFLLAEKVFKGHKSEIH